MDWSLIWFGIIILFVLCVVSIIRKAPNNSEEAFSSSQKVISFLTKGEKSNVLKVILNFAQTAGYKIDRFDETNYSIIFSDSVFSTNCFYTIKVVDSNDNNLTITVGIKSKLIQGGHARNLENMVTRIKAALYSGSV